MAGWQFRVASNAAASAWTDHTSDIERTTARFTGQAFDGQIGQGGVDLADPLGNLVIPGYRVWELNKDGLVLERGRIGIRDYERGVVRTEDAHERDITLIDCNADLSRIGVHGWSRPAETGYARVLALIDRYLSGSPRASTVIGTTWVRNANTRTMPAKRYDDANPHEVLTDCAAVEAKVFFVTVADDGTMDLFYDISTYVGYAAGISITDDNPDLVTEFPPVNPTASRDPEELFSHVRLTYGTNYASVTSSNAGVATAHDYLETIFHDDAATAATAQYRADRFVDIHDEEEVTRRCAVAVPEDKLDQIRRGMVISFRSAATNDLTPVTKRIAQLTWQPPIADGQDWLAILELEWPLKIGQRYTKPKPLPIPPSEAWPGLILEVQTIADIESTSRRVTRRTFDGDWPTPHDSVAIGPLDANAGILDTDHVTLGAEDAHTRTMFDHLAPAGAGSARLRTRICARATHGIPGGGAAPSHFAIYAGTFGVGAAVFSAIDPTPLVTGTVTFPADVTLNEFAREFVEVDVEIPVVDGRCQWTMGFDNTLQLQINGYDNGTLVPEVLDRVPSFPTFPSAKVGQDALIMQRADIPEPALPLMSVDADGSVFYHLTFYAGAAEPVLGQAVAPETVAIADGTTTTYTTRFPYAPGSLRVFVDNLREFDINETDPAAGEFEFEDPPPAGVEIRVQYIR